MTSESRLKTFGPLLFPLFLLLAMVLAFAAYPVAAGWPANPGLVSLPYMLLGLAFLLGIFFTQSRISFLCILLGVIVLLMNESCFVGGNRAKGAAIVFLSTVYVPTLTALLYHLSERGIITEHGQVRIVLVLSAMIVIFLFPEIQTLSEAVYTARFMMFKPVAPWLGIPLIGVLFLFGCIAVLLIRNRHESPYLGPNMAISLLFFSSAMNFESALWRPGQEHGIFIAFMSGAGATLIWAVLESSWRNAHIDELTELPGRRALKHHIARLGDVFCIAVLDIDHFKKINDRYGHDTGDQVLRFVAKALKEIPAGTAYRYGGEEFVVVIEDRPIEEAHSLIERLRKAIHSREFFLRGANRPRRDPKSPMRRSGKALKNSINVSVSAGIAANGHAFKTPQEVVEAADEAMYTAKDEGRNCVRLAK